MRSRNRDSRVAPAGVASLISQHWAMREEGLRDFIARVQQAELVPKALRTGDGDIVADSYGIEERDGVAIIPICGPIVRYPTWWMAYFRMTSMEVVARQVKSAQENSGIRALLFDVDTDGGEVNGCSALSTIIREAAKGDKPVEAVATGNMCSAGYWAVSGVQRISVSRTSLLPSIGIRAAFWRIDGEELIEVVSSQTPRKRMDPGSEEGRAEVQSILDSVADVFIDDVALNRDVDREKVVNEFGEGGVFVGEAAVDAGVADRVASFEEVHAELVEKTRRTLIAPLSRQRANAAAVEVVSDSTPNEDEPEEVHMAKANPGGDAGDTAPSAATHTKLTPDEVRAQYPELFQAARAEGAEAERQRIAGIDELSADSAHSALVAKAKADPAMTAEKLAVEILRADRAARGRQLNALAGDEEVLATQAPSTTASAPTKSTAKEGGKKISAHFRRRASVVAKN